ncbi:MAG: hypothetical protein DRJ41_01065 [Thermoprotei archaeon]|nr:MAG: hypothetical protein DRJ41_01065 [Thermoprotei archaeon]
MGQSSLLSSLPHHQVYGLRSPALLTSKTLQGSSSAITHNLFIPYKSYLNWALSMKRVKAITITAMMGSLAILLSLARIQIPFPVLTYLKIDFAEIPSFITYFLIGFSWGSSCAVIHWIALMIRSGDPVGPTLKFLAVISNLTGMFVVRRYLPVRQGNLLPSLEIAGGLGVRVIFMSLVNAVVMLLLFPHYLDYSRKLIEATGISVTSNEQVFLWVLFLLGVFNSLHALISSLPSLVISRSVRKVLGSYIGLEAPQ